MRRVPVGIVAVEKQQALNIVCVGVSVCVCVCVCVLVLVIRRAKHMHHIEL